jgi:hypothetical protein
MITESAARTVGQTTHVKESPAEAGLVCPVRACPFGHSAAEERHTQVTANCRPHQRTFTWPISRRSPEISTRITPAIGARRYAFSRSISTLSTANCNHVCVRFLICIKGYSRECLQPLHAALTVRRNTMNHRHKFATPLIQLVRRDALRLRRHGKIRVDRQLEIPAALRGGIHRQFGNHVQQIAVDADIDALPLLRMQT